MSLDLDRHIPTWGYCHLSYPAKWMVTYALHGTPCWENLPHYLRGAPLHVAAMQLLCILSLDSNGELALPETKLRPGPPPLPGVGTVRSFPLTFPTVTSLTAGSGPLQH